MAPYLSCLAMSQRSGGRGLPPPCPCCCCCSGGGGGLRDLPLLHSLLRLRLQLLLLLLRLLWCCEEDLLEEEAAVEPLSSDIVEFVLRLRELTVPLRREEMEGGKGFPLKI